MSKKVDFNCLYVPYLLLRDFKIVNGSIKTNNGKSIISLVKSHRLKLIIYLNLRKT